MPFLLQSSQEEMREVAKELKVGFVVKTSKTITQELADYIGREFGFGDFIVTHKQTGEIIARASDLAQFEVVDIHRVGNTIGVAALARSGISGNGEQDGFGFCAIGGIGSVVEGARHQSPIAHGHIGFVGSRHSHLVGVGFIFGVLVWGWPVWLL